MGDLREMKDTDPLGPGCGHEVVACSTAFSCTDHDTATGEHVHRYTGSAHRGGLGTLDWVKTPFEVRWRDDRPAATVGDLRALIRQAQEADRG